MPPIDTGIVSLPSGHVLLTIPISASSYADRDIDEADGEIRKQLGAQCGGGAVADAHIERTLRIPPQGESSRVWGRQYSVQAKATCVMLVAPSATQGAGLRKSAAPK